MEENKDILMTNRNAGACIKSGYNLYFGNFKKLFKSSWQSALAYALAVSALGSLIVINGPQLFADTMMTPDYVADNAPVIQEYGDSGKGSSVMMIVAAVALIIVGGIVEVMTYSRVVEFLHHHRDGITPEGTLKWGKTIWQTALRTLKGVVFTLIIAAIPATLWLVAYKYLLYEIFAEPSAHVASIILVAIATTVIMALLLPLLFVMMKYIVGKNTTSYLNILREDYGGGLRQMGFTFVILLTNIIVLIVAGYIILQPAVIMSVANLNAHQGQVYGDPLGMPEYATWLTAVVFFIAGFIQIYIRMSVLFSFYYMYGTIETREEGKKKFNAKSVV